MLKYSVFDAGFPVTVVRQDDSPDAKTLACYTPDMLIDALNNEAKLIRVKGNHETAMILEASAALLDALKKHHAANS